MAVNEFIKKIILSKFLNCMLSSALKNIKDQRFYEIIHSFALQGMNFGGGGDLSTSGEAFVLKYLLGKLKEKKNIINIFDVGANEGQYTLLVAKIFENININIFSFELAKKSFEKLQVNAGHKKNIKIYNFGFGDRYTKAVLFSNMIGSGIASLYNRRLDYCGIKMELKEEIEIKTIDDFCHQNGINHIDLLKLDVEGSEMKVLEGAAKMINSNSVSYIQFEFGGCHIDSRTFFQDFYYFLNEKYKIYRILTNGLQSINNYKETYEIFITTNYLAEMK